MNKKTNKNTKNITAYCLRSGEIRFGKSCAKGALPIINGPAKLVREKVMVMARMSYNDKPLVPGVPEADDETAALAAVMRFRNYVQIRIDRATLAINRGFMNGRLLITGNMAIGKSVLANRIKAGIEATEPGHRVYILEIANPDSPTFTRAGVRELEAEYDTVIYIAEEISPQQLKSRGITIWKCIHMSDYMIDPRFLK